MDKGDIGLLENAPQSPTSFLDFRITDLNTTDNNVLIPQEEVKNEEKYVTIEKDHCKTSSEIFQDIKLNTKDNFVNDASANESNNTQIQEYKIEDTSSNNSKEIFTGSTPSINLPNDYMSSNTKNIETRKFNYVTKPSKSTPEQTEVYNNGYGILRKTLQQSTVSLGTYWNQLKQFTMSEVGEINEAVGKANEVFTDSFSSLKSKLQPIPSASSPESSKVYTERTLTGYKQKLSTRRDKLLQEQQTIKILSRAQLMKRLFKRDSEIIAMSEQLLALQEKSIKKNGTRKEHNNERQEDPLFEKEQYPALACHSQSTKLDVQPKEFESTAETDTQFKDSQKLCTLNSKAATSETLYQRALEEHSPLKELRNSEKKKEIEKRLIEEREKMKDHKEQLQGTFQQVDSWPERYEKSSLRVKNLEEHLREAHQKIYGQNLELQGKEKELEDLHAILTSLKEDLEDAKNSLNCSKKENIALEAQSKKAEEYIEKLRIELKSTKEEYEYIKKELEATLQRLAGTESDYETSKKLLKRKINNLKKALSKQLKLNDDKLKENKLVPCRDNVPSVNNINNTESKRENDIKFCYIKNVLLKFVTSTCNEQRALISIISQLLKLNESEKEMLVKSLEKQSNTFW